MWSLIWMAWRTSSLNVTWSASERDLTKWLPRRMVCSPITIESTPLSPIMSRASGIWISTERALSNTKLRISRSMIRRILQSWSGLPSQNMRANPYGVGVVGIEIDYTTMAEQVESIRLYGNGYAFLSDADGNIFFHPKIDVSQLTEETKPVLPYDAVAKNTFIRYTYDGVEKIAAWLPLSNGMRLNVAVPVFETEGEWERLVGNYLVFAAIVLVAASILTMFYTRRVTKPLVQLTEAAEQIDKGNYDYDLNYDSDDEVGRLTNTFKRLSGHMKDHISDLNKRAYVDALTSVRNKGAYTSYIEEMQKRMDEAGGQEMAFAVGVFDCDNLKWINDRYGHEKGDIYLKTASRLICHVFQHSPVFRIGGDEFSVILQNADYQNREALVQQFKEDMAEISASAKHDWEEAHIAMGIAVYEPQADTSVNDVIRRADESMYENKRGRKAGR